MIFRNLLRRSSHFKFKCLSSPEDRFAGYKGVRNVTIKKGTASLGIMIIEGRHAEVGQGIFISDIQEGSAAEQAGLQIGDMILAVNKDSLLGSSYDSAASLLKKTEGLVQLTVCNPNRREGDSPEAAAPAPARAPTPAEAPRLATPVVIRPTTPVAVVASPAKVEAPPDPATAPVVPGKETHIELNSANSTLGVVIVGGSDTLINGGAVILEVYPGGVVAKDGRLQPGDQILECNGVPITKEMTHERVLLTIKQTLPKIRMTVLRPESISYNEVEVELARKPGKGLGLGMMVKKPPPGVYISDIIPGGSADLDGRLQRGDLLVAVDGKDLSSASQEEAAAAIKSVSARAVVKVKRYKVVR